MCHEWNKNKGVIRRRTANTKEKGQKDKQRSTKHDMTQKTKDQAP
jgi:hypothetical protein